jgi:hypothetical protein
MLLLFLHHYCIFHLMHCIILLLDHICSCTLDHTEWESEGSTEQAQAKDPANLALDQGKP